MTLHHTEKLDKGYHKLPPTIQKQVDHKLALFVEYGYGYPSLRLKFYERYKKEGIYELSITKNYRILLQKITDDEFFLLRVGPHSILDKFKII